MAVLFLYASFLKRSNKPPASKAVARRSFFRIAIWLSRVAKSYGAARLSSPEQQHHREEVTNARHAAEALFKPKGQPTAHQAGEFSSPVDQPARKPRILRMVTSTPVRSQQVASPIVRAKRMAQSIPASQIPRIRTWLQYGMTIPQVARLYGVAVGVIERLL
jgi:hypothetical protein